MSAWSERAEELLELALDQLRSDIDPIPSISGALACLRIDEGEQEPDMDLLATPDPPCSCPPELAARGGYASGCPAAHGTAA